MHSIGDIPCHDACTPSPPDDSYLVGAWDGATSNPEGILAFSITLFLPSAVCLFQLLCIVRICNDGGGLVLLFWSAERRSCLMKELKVFFINTFVSDYSNTFNPNTLNVTAFFFFFKALQVLLWLSQC